MWDYLLPFPLPLEQTHSPSEASYTVPTGKSRMQRLKKEYQVLKLVTSVKMGL